MYEAETDHSESNQACSVEESSVDPTGFIGKLKTLIRETEEKTAQRNKREYKKKETDQECSKEKFVSKNAKTPLSEFTKWTNILENENDRLKEEIEKKSEASNDVQGLGESTDERTIECLKTENSTLRQVCYDISRVNKEWQNYNKEVQLYIRQLEEAVQARSPKRFEDFLESKWAIQRERDTSSRTEEAGVPLLTRYNDLLKEACQLQKELEVSRKTEESLRRELEDQRSESSEAIKLLNCQLSFYKEDYEEERRERQAVQATSTELSKEVNRVRSQLRECQRRLKEVQEVSRSFDAKALHHSPDFVFNIVEREGHNSRRSGHLSADDSPEDPVIPDSSTISADEKDDETVLKIVSAYECPGCGKTFPNDRNTDYLEHYEECQRTEGL